MKTLTILLCLAAITTGIAWADGSAVSVQNQEGWRFWYVLDPPGFTEEPPGSPWLTRKAEALLAREGGEFPFTVLEPGGVVTFDGLAAGTHYLLGFFEDDSVEEFPVRLLALQADDSLEVRHYDVYSLPEILMAARGQGVLARFARGQPEPAAAEAAAEAPAEATVEVAASPPPEQPAVVAGAEPASEQPAVVAGTEPASEQPAVAAAAEPASEQPAVVAAAEPAAAEPAPEATASAEPLIEEPLATFSESYDPVYFSRESRDGFVVLPIASSRAWGNPGTRLSSFRGSLQDGTVTLRIESANGFAKDASCFLYVFPQRTGGATSDFTFEVRPEFDGRAAVVLWQKGRAIPRIVGSARTEGSEFQWTARTEDLPPELAEELGPASTLDLTTAWLDETSATWEEFYFTTFSLADLTR